MKKTINKFNKVFNVIGVFLLVFIAVAMFSQVLLRKLGYAISWSDELSRYAYILLVFIGTISMSSKGDHITITSFLRKLPKFIRWKINFLIYFAVTCFNMILTYAFFRAAINTGDVRFSVLTIIKMRDFYFALTIAMVFITLFTIYHTANIMINKNESEDMEEIK